MDENDSNLTADDHNENNLESSEVNEPESHTEHLLNSYNENNSNDKTEHAKSKEDYSACIMLIEKFQEAVIDNAVRVIQAAFKRFRERRRFLKLRKAATVIQKSIRQWLKRRHLSETTECHLAITGVSEQRSEMERKCSLSDEQQRGVTVDCGSEIERSRTVQDSYDDIRDDPCSHEGLAEDKDSLSVSVSDKTDQFENSFDSLDASSLSGSADNISDAGVCVDQSEDNSPVSDPDSLSLADSGIDMYSDVPIEATIVDGYKCSESENPLPNAPEETSSELQ